MATSTLHNVLRFDLHHSFTNVRLLQRERPSIIPPMATQKVDILIIGGGVIGASVASELQAAGRSVTLIERGQPGQGCSYGNAGWLTPCFAMPLPQPGMFWKSVGWLLDANSPLYIQPQVNPTLFRWMWQFLRAMNEERMNESITVLTAISTFSLEFYKKLAARTKRKIGFENRGLLMVSATESGLEAANLEMQLMNARGIAGRSLSKDEVLKFEPSLKPIVRGGVFFPDEAQANPYETTLAIMDEFVAAGGRVIANTEAFDFDVRDGRIARVHTTQGDFEAELVVLASGSWSNAIAKKLDLSIPILGGKGYSMSVDMTENKPQHPIMIIERKIAITPFANSVRLAGTLELVDQDFSISPNRVRGIHRGAQEYLHFDKKNDASSEPLYDLSAVRDVWRGLRPCTPDGVPVIGPSTKLQNLFYCAGHQLLGFQSAPGSGRLAADLILKRTPLTDPRPFRADRFE
jgi:D-amino-acid dehydrogenase